jgi:glycolate oxidase FAD binding subunit
VVGAESIVSEPSVCASLAVDGLVPQCAVYPRRAEEVAGLLRAAAQQGLAVIPCRNMTKLTLGNPPRRYDLALSLKEMNQVWRYEPDDLTVSVEPGMKLGDFQHFLARRKLWLPLDPPGGARSSLGGIVATNAAGPLRLKYGAPRDMVVGMRIATTEGELVSTGGRVVKNVAGYDISKLMIGSFGTLGVIVEVNFKLYPIPPGRATWIFRLDGLDTARELRRKVLNSPLSPMRMVLLDARAAAIARADGSALERGYEFWIEFGGSEAMIRRCAGAVQDLSPGMSGKRLDDAEAEAGWERISNLDVPAGTAAQPVALKATLPVSTTEEFLALVQDEARTAGLPAACFAQSGAGIIHVCLSAPAPPALLAAFTAKLREMAIKQGGALVIVRGSPEFKSQIDAWGPAGDDFALMRKLKELWDPRGTLSPGRFIGGL